MGIADDIGKGLGGVFSNPSVLLLAGLGIGLFIFRKPIQEAFANFGGQISNLFSPSGIIQQAGQDAGSFVFGLGQDAGQAIFDQGAQAGQFVFDQGVAFGDLFGKTTTDLAQSAQRAAEEGGPLSSIFDLIKQQINTQRENPTGGFDLLNIPESARRAAEEGGPLSSIFDLFNPPQDPFQGPRVDPSTGDFTGIPFTGPLSELETPLSLFDFANQFNITPSQAFSVQKDLGGIDFEQIAAIPSFGQILAQNPDLTASQIANVKLIQAGGGEGFDFGTNTGQALEVAKLDFGQSVFLKRSNEGFDLLKEAEALRANASLGGGSGGLFANPQFPITLGEAFLGKTGTVVSQSISNLTTEQLKDFILKFG